MFISDIYIYIPDIASRMYSTPSAVELSPRCKQLHHVPIVNIKMMGSCRSRCRGAKHEKRRNRNRPSFRVLDGLQPAYQGATPAISLSPPRHSRSG